METYKLKFTRLQNEIFRFLSIEAGMKFNQSKIAKMLKVSPTAIAKALPLLEKEELLKKIENLKLIQEAGLIDFLFNEFPGCTIILFGSYSKGEDSVTSDIDIAVVGTKGKEMDLIEFNKKLERTININFYE